MELYPSAIKSTLLIVFLSLSQFLSAQDDAGATPIEGLPPDSLNPMNTTINLVLGETSGMRSTGSIHYIDAGSELLRDARSDLSSAIYGKVPGVFDSYNLWGTGDAVVVVDGVRQDAYYYESLNLREIESIIVLKDAMSKALYGAQGDQGVILINTKRGIDGPQKIRITGEYSLSEPRALPHFLDAAGYMEKFNEAQLNEGVDPLYVRFGQEQINANRSASDRTRYPDNDFYTDEYLRKFRSDMDVFADVVGGNENAKYYVSTEWAQSNGWLNTDIPDKSNRLNFRGNLDFLINKYMKMGLDASARLNLIERPNINAESAEDSYWRRFATILPNAYPVLWDPAEITDPATRDMVLEEARLMNGQVLGGNSSYANNQIYGDLVQNGRVRDQQRIVQFGGKLDIDLNFIAKGLSAKGYAGMNFYNSLFTQQEYQYAIYEPVFSESTGSLDTVSIHGVDRPSTRFRTNSDYSDSYRQITYYGNLNYFRHFGLHELSAAAVIYGDQITRKGILQNNVLFHTGFTGNYMYNNRYVAELSLMGIGTRKLAEGDRMELAPTAGLAWIVSEEDFMEDVSIVNYLKIRASYGISKNDGWDQYFLYRNLFSRGSGFDYFNGTHENDETVYESVANDLRLQKREDISVGLDALLFDKALGVEMGYFRSASLDNVTLMSSTYPQLMGYEDLIYENYNSDLTQGIELGLNYTYRLSGDFTASAGGNLLFISPKITKYEEPLYEGVDADLRREGTATDGMWALVDDGLYGEGDFNSNGTLADELPVPAFGAVQPGDIKYLDQNGDGFIDQKDLRIVGHDLRTQYSAYLDVRFRNLGLYVLGIGRLGDSNYRSGSYFRVFGDIKYSEYALQAYGPENKDVNALHPRLSTSSGGHNDRNSSFWIYRNNSFTLPAIQLTYHFQGKNGFSFLKQSRAYVRGSNLVVLGANKEYAEVNPYGAPKLKSVVLGLVASF